MPKSRLACVLIALALTVGAGCATTPPPAPGPAKAGETPERFNRELGSVVPRTAGHAAGGTPDYRVGRGDVLEIAVFQAEELNRTVRVRPDGSISLPLLGAIAVEGQATAELEQTLASRFGERYLHDPQVSVFVREYRAHPVSVLGEVQKPAVHYLQEPRTVLEMLSEAGGLTEDAGRVVHLRRAERGTEEATFLSIDLDELLASYRRGLDVPVRGGDTVYVPKAGVVYVQGAVRKPGGYPMTGRTTVLKAIALAGGLESTARSSDIQVLRSGGEAANLEFVDYGAIEESPDRDVDLGDGDVVVVRTSAAKLALVVVWRALAGLVSVSKGI